MACQSLMEDDDVRGYTVGVTSFGTLSASMVRWSAGPIIPHN